MKGLYLYAAVAVLALGCSSAFATPIIDVGDHVVNINDPATWAIPIYVTGGDSVQGCDLNVQIGDGGPDAGGTTGPQITAVDLEGGIFAGNNNGQNDLGSIPQVAMYSITTKSGSVGADGLLTTVTIDPNGFTTGTWPLKLHGTLNGPTDFAPGQATITDGTITLVPEPASLVLLGLGTLAVIRRRRIAAE